MLAGAALVATVALSACGGDGPPASPDLAKPSLLAPSQRPPAGAQFGRSVVRVPGRSASDVAGAAVLAAYPAERGERPAGLILTDERDWRRLVVGASLAAAPVNGALLPIKRDYLPTATVDLVGRLKPTGFRRAHGLEAVVLGRAGGDVFTDLSDAGLKLSQLKARTAAQLAADTVPYRAGFAGATTSSVLVVSDAERGYALAAAAWSAFSGDTVAFVSRDGVPAATRRILRQRVKLRLEKPTIYVLGPPSAVSARAVSALRAYGTVRRVGGRTPAEASVALARYHDPKTGFGWGLRRGPASVSLVDQRAWGGAAGALNFAARGPRAPVLLLDRRDALPRPVERYLRGLRRARVFAFGDERAVATSLLTQVDTLLGGAPSG
jgi:hypothetical protein